MDAAASGAHIDAIGGGVGPICSKVRDRDSAADGQWTGESAQRSELIIEDNNVSERVVACISHNRDVTKSRVVRERIAGIAFDASRVCRVITR